MDMQRLFERIADTHDGKVEAEDIREDYMRLRVEVIPQQSEALFEVHDATIGMGSIGVLHVPLVRIERYCGFHDDEVPILVSPIPSAILAVALR